MEEEKSDLLKFLRESDYYIKKREQALKGEKIEEFIEELEKFSASIWKSLYRCNKDLEKLKETLGMTEIKTVKLEELLIQRLFESVTDGITQ